jgi:hypothetical protein
VGTVRLRRGPRVEVSCVGTVRFRKGPRVDVSCVGTVRLRKGPHGTMKNETRCTTQRGPQLS